MRTFLTVLRLFGGLIFAVGALHLAMGLHADALLGAAIPPAVFDEPTLDSQNRFFGVSFTLYGALLILSASDLHRYAPARGSR